MALQQCISNESDWWGSCRRAPIRSTILSLRMKLLVNREMFSNEI
jgi:hypothetical protein